MGGKCEGMERIDVVRAAAAYFTPTCAKYGATAAAIPEFSASCAQKRMFSAAARI